MNNLNTRKMTNKTRVHKSLVVKQPQANHVEVEVDQQECSVHDNEMHQAWSDNHEAES